MQMQPAARKALAEQTVRQARETISNRIDQYGVSEPTITVYGSGDIKDQIIVELPGVDDPGRIIYLIKTTAHLELKLCHPEKPGPYPDAGGGHPGFRRNYSARLRDSSLPRHR